MKINISLLCIALGSLLHAAVSSKIAAAQRPQRLSTSHCQVCMNTMTFIRHLTVQQMLPLRAVREKLKDLFKILPSNIKNEELLANLDVYVSMVKEGKDPRTICKFLGKCTPSTPERLNITPCEVCDAVVAVIKINLLISNTSVNVIIYIVETLCSLLGGEIVSEECHFILGKIQQIIEWIEDKVDPKDICVRLGLCPNKTLMVRSKNVKMPTCHIIVLTLRAQSHKGWSEDKMKEKIKTICSTLKLNKFHCYRIQTNLKTILALIKKGQRAEEVCGNNIKPNNDLSLVNDQPTNYCHLCTMIMEIVTTQSVSQLDGGMKQIETKLNQVCGKLEDLNQECKYVVDLVIDDIERNVQYTGRFLSNPSGTCRALKLCPKLLEY